jgi:hypothetical protein
MATNYYIDWDMTDEEMRMVLDRLESVAYSKLQQCADCDSYAVYNDVWTALNKAWHSSIKVTKQDLDSATNSE